MPTSDTRTTSSGAPSTRAVSGRVVGLFVTGSAVLFALGAYLAYRSTRDPAKIGREPTTWDEPVLGSTVTPSTLTPASTAPASTAPASTPEGVCNEPVGASPAPGCASAKAR